MSNEKKPGIAFWAITVLVAVAIYVASVGPACRILGLAGDPDWAVTAYHAFYVPVWFVHENGPAPVRRAIYWYCRAGTTEFVPEACSMD